MPLPNFTLCCLPSMQWSQNSNLSNLSFPSKLCLAHYIKPFSPTFPVISRLSTTGVLSVKCIRRTMKWRRTLSCSIELNISRKKGKMVFCASKYKRKCPYFYFIYPPFLLNEKFCSSPFSLLLPRPLPFSSQTSQILILLPPKQHAILQLWSLNKFELALSLTPLFPPPLDQASFLSPISEVSKILVPQVLACMSVLMIKVLNGY